MKTSEKQHFHSKTIVENIFSTVITFVVIFLVTFALTNDNAIAAPECPNGGATMSKVELYFGLDIPGGGKVEPDAWQTFIEEEVTSRFPDGLTIDEVAGQWRDVKTGKTIQESSRALMILYQPSPEAEQAIETIREAYKSQFHQDAVMRLDEINCVKF